jgi:hypothetical protein
MNKNIDREIDITWILYKKIEKQTESEFSELLGLVEEGISLLIKTTEYLQKLEPFIDKSTPEGASKAAVWRFVSTLPSTALWSLQTAKYGALALSKYLLRLCLEELVSLAFYEEFPNQALEQITRDSDRDQIDFGEKVARLNLEHGSGIRRLWGGLSNTYSHANLIIQHELLARDDSGEVYLSGGPVFNHEQSRAIQHQLLIILGNALKYVLFRFERLYQIEKWKSRFDSFLNAAERATNQTPE